MAKRKTESETKAFERMAKEAEEQKEELAPVENVQQEMPTKQQSPDIVEKEAQESKIQEAPALQGKQEPATMKKPVKVQASKTSKLYHLPGMRYYDKVFDYHRIEFDSEEEAIEAGYRKAPR